MSDSDGVTAEDAAVRLSALAATVRSSNASGTLFTFDVMFDDRIVFDQLYRWGGIDANLVAGLYRLSAHSVQVYWYEPALTLKITLPRPTLSGQPADTDIDGKQQHAPLLDIAVPAEVLQLSPKHVGRIDS